MRGYKVWIRKVQRHKIPGYTRTQGPWIHKDYKISEYTRSQDMQGTGIHKDIRSLGIQDPKICKVQEYRALDTQGHRILKVQGPLLI